MELAHVMVAGHVSMTAGSSGPGAWSAGLVAGAVAGLGLAVPVGAVGVLVAQEALMRGRAHGLAAAAGVAATDLLYAVVAVLAGMAAAAWLEPHRTPVRLVAAAALAAVAGWGWRRAWRSRRASLAVGPGGDAAPDAGDVARGGARWRQGRAVVGVRFAALTLVNPVTVLYFVVVVAGFGGRLGSGPARAGFAAGVFLGSACWHALLALVAAAAGARLSHRARTATGLVGHGVVGAMAVVLALHA